MTTIHRKHERCGECGSITCGGFLEVWNSTT
jgi:hypothetical protein